MSIRNLNETCISDAQFDLEMKRPQSVWKLSRPTFEYDIIAQLDMSEVWRVSYEQCPRFVGTLFSFIRRALVQY
jgi:hypothetical protein